MEEINGMSIDDLNEINKKINDLFKKMDSIEVVIGTNTVKQAKNQLSRVGKLMTNTYYGQFDENVFAQKIEDGKVINQYKEEDEGTS